MNECHVVLMADVASCHRVSSRARSAVCRFDMTSTPFARSSRPFVIGSFEFQLKTLDRELAQLVEEYFNEGFMTKGIAGSVLPLRTVPVNRSLDVAWPVAPYEDARQIIKGKDKIAVATRGPNDRGGLRASPHFYNTPAEIDRLVAGIARALKSGV